MCYEHDALKKENERLSLENTDLRKQIERLTENPPIPMPVVKELVDLRRQVEAVRRIIRRMGFIADNPRVENDLVVFAFEAMFWEQDSRELHDLKQHSPDNP